MIRYLAWTERVLRVVLQERPPYQPLTIPSLAGEVGLPLDGLDDDERKAVILGLDHVLRDLAAHDFVTYSSSGQMVDYPPQARRFRVERLTSTWPQLRSGFLAPDDEAFLAALAALSEKPGAVGADVSEVTGEDVFVALGWEWDGMRAVEIAGHLKQLSFVEARFYGGPSVVARITYAGLVRTLDDTGALLREAEDHLHAGRLRAAGCIAAVELERRLRALVARPMHVSRKRDPSLEDYNKAAFEADLIDQETWESISTLAVIRKRCVHVLDREPESDEVRRLIDGVELILRRYPPPTSG